MRLANALCRYAELARRIQATMTFTPGGPVPSTVWQLLQRAGLAYGGCVPWGTPLPARGPGVYLVSLDDDARSSGRTVATCPVSRQALEELLRSCPELRLDHPVVDEVRQRGPGNRIEVEAINRYLQRELKQRDEPEVAAVEAARWLDEAGLLRDSSSRPGLPLRKLVRQERLAGQAQEPNGRWFIRRIDQGRGPGAGRVARARVRANRTCSPFAVRPGAPTGSGSVFAFSP